MTESVTEDRVLRPGEVEWHSSEADGGPDVGIRIGLNGGKSLWVGELLDSDGGGHSGFVVWGDGKEAVAPINDWDLVRWDLVCQLFEDHVAPALRHTAPAASERQQWHQLLVAMLGEVERLGGDPLSSLHKSATEAAAALSTASTSESVEQCQRCGHHNPSWAAPSPLWNAVMRGGSIDGPHKFGDTVCASCFMELAEAAGVASQFRVTAEQVNAPLETTTPSGRVWNDGTWLWEEPKPTTPPEVSQRARNAAVRLLESDDKDYAAKEIRLGNGDHFPIVQAFAQFERSITAPLIEALEPFAAMGRVMEKRAVVTFGRHVPDSEIVCESSGEAGMGILVMGHFRDATALLPNAPGWGGIYRPTKARAALEGRQAK